MKTDAKITNTLHRQVEGEKQVAEYTLQVLNDLEPLFKKYSNTKINKSASYGWMKKFNDELLLIKANYPSKVRWYINVVTKSLYITINKWCVFGKHYMDNGDFSHDDGNYYKLELFIGVLGEDYQTLIYNPETFQKVRDRLEQVMHVDYAFILEQRAKMKELYKEISNINGTIPYYAKCTSEYN